MFGMGHWEILIIVLIILLVFGAKRIPDMAQGLGKGIKEFRKAIHDVQEEIDITPPPADEAKKIRSPEQTVHRTPAAQPTGDAQPTGAQPTSEVEKETPSS